MSFEVSQSVIKTWRRCRAKYNYRYRELLERRKPIVQLIRGTILGECFDAMAERRTNSKSPHWLTSLKKYEKEYGKLFKEEQEYYGDILGEVKRISTMYEQLYSGDGFTYQQRPDGKPFELPLEVELCKGITFTGHIDKMPRDKEGRVWDMDHKSHKNIPDIDARFSDLQQVFYVWAAPLSGYPKLTGVIWDYVRTKPPAIPEMLKTGELTQRKNIDTTYDVYLEEIKRKKLDQKDYREILKNLKKRGQVDFFQRVKLPSPSPILIKNVVDDAISTAKDIQRVGGVDKTRTMDRTCKSCDFYSLCHTEFRGLDSKFIRKTEYRVQENPRHDHSNLDED